MWCILQINYENGTSKPIMRNLPVEVAKDLAHELTNEVMPHLDYKVWPEDQMPHPWMQDS